MSILGEVSSIGIVTDPAIWTERTGEDDYNSAERHDLPRTVEGQQLFYFGKKKTRRFDILPDPNGHNVFDTLDLKLPTGQNQIAQNWSKQEVINILCLIYRRLEAFLNTIQVKGYTNPYSKWQVKLEKKEEIEVAKSTWWQQVEQTSSDLHEFQPKIRKSFGLGGWSNQLRIVLRCRQHTGPNTIARERARAMFSSVSDARMGIPVLPFRTFRTKTARKLQVLTNAGGIGGVFVDEWQENGNHHYVMERGVQRIMFNGFSWRWGVSNPFSVQSRNPPLATPDYIDRFDKPFRTARFGSSSTGKIKFSDPYAIEVLFQ